MLIKLNVIVSVVYNFDNFLKYEFPVTATFLINQN